MLGVGQRVDRGDPGKRSEVLDILLRLAERIYHVWRRNGVEVDRIALDIQGGSNDGYRAWSHKQNFPADVEGKWTVQVVTDAGQMLVVLRYRVGP